MLARTILDNPMLARNKTVLDLGSGCGAVTLAAVLSGAKKVIANDIDVNAVMALTVKFTRFILFFFPAKHSFEILSYLRLMS